MVMPEGVGSQPAERREPREDSGPAQPTDILSARQIGVRIIPRLDVKGPNLVKGVHLEGLRVLGKPERFAHLYYEAGADELIYMDVVASLYGRNSLLSIIERTAQETFIPLTVGGGLRTIDDIQSVLRAGADKVSLNTAAIRNPSLIPQVTKRFGSSTITVSVEAKRHPDGRYEAYTDNGREPTGVEVFGWARRVEELGAGEILVTSIDREGTGTGYDVELTRRIAESVSIPVIACGGAGRPEHVYEVIHAAKADAVAAASLFHYHVVKHMDLSDDYSSEGNVEFLKRKHSISRIEDAELGALKAFLRSRNVPSRH